MAQGVLRIALANLPTGIGRVWLCLREPARAAG